MHVQSSKFKVQSLRRSWNDIGFTLIEILAAMTVFVTVAGMILSIIFVSLRGSKKSDSVVIVRQNGDVAMSQMARMIRYAKSLDSPSSCVPSSTSSSITITSLDNMQTVFSCPVSAGQMISSNSADLMDSTAVSVSSCSFACSQPTLSDPPNISISFTLSSLGGGSFVENNVSLPFQSSVTLRNYGGQ